MSEPYLNNKSILNVLHPQDDLQELACLAAVINSRAESVVYKATAVKGARRIFPKVVAKNLAELPYPAHVPHEAGSAIGDHVHRLLALNVKLREVKTGQERAVLAREASAIERELDRIIYELFGLTEDEVALIDSYSAPELVATK